MCGRYRLSRRKQSIAVYFETESEVDWEPRYNIAPSQDEGIIWQDRQGIIMHAEVEGELCRLQAMSKQLRQL